MSPSNGIPLYLRDQVGIFHGIAPGEVPENKVSDMKNGDHNSGWHFAKYPFYSDEDAGRREADYSEIRLAEIYYSLAECEFRTGNNEEAGKLLNHVRKRYYPVDKYQEYLYLPDGQIKLTENELIDEWGREFLQKVVDVLIYVVGISLRLEYGGTNSLMQIIIQKYFLLNGVR